jgi:hypothetical protein
VHVYISVVIYTGARIAQKYSTGLRAGLSAVGDPVGARNFSPHHRVEIGSGAHPVSYTMSITGSSLGVKRPGREADHSPPFNAKIKEMLF